MRDVNFAPVADVSVVDSIKRACYVEVDETAGGSFLCSFVAHLVNAPRNAEGAKNIGDAIAAVCRASSHDIR